MLTVVYDACVLYSAVHRDLLMFLAVSRSFQACWSNEIHEEWMRNLLRNQPGLQRERLERTRRMMDEHVDDCLIEGYEHLIDTLYLPDPNDRHVLAAAVHAGARIIVTFNLDDFPKSALAPYGIEAMTPDDFVDDLIESDPKIVLEALDLHRVNLRNPPKTIDEFMESLQQHQLPKTVAFLRKHLSKYR